MHDSVDRLAKALSDRYKIEAVRITTEVADALDHVAEYQSDLNHVLYDLTPDDQRFVMLRETATVS